MNAEKDKALSCKRCGLYPTAVIHKYPNGRGHVWVSPKDEK